MKYQGRVERAAYLILLMTLVSCSSSRPPQPSLSTMPSRSGLQARLQDLQARGATEVLPTEQYHAVNRTIGNVTDGASLTLATRSLDEYEAAFDVIAAEEASTAREAYIRLEWETAQTEKKVGWGADCNGLPYSISVLERQLEEIRLLAYLVEGDARAALRVQHLAADTRRAVNDLIAAAVVCGTVELTPDNAEQMLEAAGRMAMTKLAYGSAVRLYAAIIDGSLGTEAAAEAPRRIAKFGPDLQRKLAETVRSAAAACDNELAHQYLAELDALMAALSERAVALVDTSTSRSMPELSRLVRAMDTACGSPRTVDHSRPVTPALPPSADVTEIEALIVSGQHDAAQARIGLLSNAEERSKLEALLHAAESTNDAEALLQAGRLDEGIALAEKAWQSALLARRSGVLADGLSARAEAALARGRPLDALEDVQRALIAAPESDRAQRTAATVYRRLGEQARATGQADEALRLFSESARLRDHGGLRLEMARLLAARGRFQEARREAEHAERLGVPIDITTRIQVFALADLMIGESEAALLELDTVGSENAGAVDDLKVHVLRLPLSESLGRLAADLANAGGLTHRGAGVLAFVGSDTSGFKGSLATVLNGLSGPGSSGFSDDYRYMAFSDSSGGIIIYDARVGKAKGRADDELAKGRVRSLAALAQAEVVESLAWFLVKPIEEALNANVARRKKDETVLVALEEMVTAGLDYALLANSRGRASLVKGSISEDHETGLQIAAVSAPNTRPVVVDGASYREVVAPVKIAGSVQAMLVLGVAVDEVTTLHSPSR